MIAKKQKIKKKRRFKKIISFVLITVLLIALTVFLIISNLEIRQKRAEMLDRIEALQEEIHLLSERNEQLKMGIMQTESDDYWQARATEHGYFPPGQQPIVVIPPSAQEKEGEEAAGEKGLWENIKEMFGF